MNGRRLLSLLLISVLVMMCLPLNMVSAESTALPPATFTILTMNPAVSTILPTDTPVGKALKEATNVELKVEYLVGTDSRQKASLLIAAGDYPDFIYPGDASGDFKAAGACVPLNNYFENSVNIKNWYKNYEVELMRASNDGEIYFLSIGFPNEDRMWPAAGYYVGADVLKEAGYPIIKDFQQWQDIIIDYCQKNPTYDGQPTIGFTAASEGWRASGLQYGGSRFLGGFPNDGLTVVNQEDLSAHIVMTQDFHKEYYKMINRFWNLGIADKEMFMQTNDQYNAKIASGRVVGMYDQRGMFIEAINALEAGKPDRMLVAFPLVLPGVERERYRGPRGFNAGNGLILSTSCKDPDRAFAYLDQVASPENQKLLQWGIEGTDYELVDGIFHRSDELWAKYLDPEYGKATGVDQFSVLGLNFAPPLENVDGVNITDETKTDEYAQMIYKDFQKDLLANYADRGITRYIDFFFPSYDAFYEAGWSVRQRIDTDDPRKIAGETALEITREHMAIICTAPESEFDAKWDAFMSALAPLPLAEYELLATEMIRASAAIYAK